MVVGSFEVGGVLTSATDVLLHEASGKAYSSAGPYPQTVLAGTVPGAGFTDQSLKSLRGEVYSDFILVDKYIPKGINTPTVDCATYIQQADTDAALKGKALFFSGKEYLIKSALTVSTPWYGVTGKTKIAVSSSFVYPVGAPDPRRYSAITNLNAANAYNQSTADVFVMRGFEIVDNGGSGGADTLGLSNIKGGLISDCIVSALTSSIRTPLDIFACVKNLTIKRSRFSNLTQNTTGGGAAWVRNITNNGALSANTTENVHFDDCIFEQTALDEAFAVYGVQGMSRGIRATNCLFDGTLPSTQKHGTLVTVFPLGGNASAAVRDVVFSGCTFKSNNFIDHVLRVGSSSDSARVCDDIHFDCCTLTADLKAAATTAVARYIPCVGSNVTFTNNTVNAEASTVQLTYGVQRFSKITGTTISGNIATALADSPFVDGCITKSITGSIAINCLRISNSILSAAAGGIACNNTNRYDIFDNKIDVTDTTGSFFAVFLNTLAGSAPWGNIKDNVITLNNASATAVRVAGTGAAKSKVVGNTAEGVGKTVSGSQLKEVSGNDWYGKLDSMRDVGYLDSDHNGATPIGTFTAAITHTLGTSRRLLGFVKTANAGVGADWQPVYTETSNN